MGTCEHWADAAYPCPVPECREGVRLPKGYLQLDSGERFVRVLVGSPARWNWKPYEPGEAKHPLSPPGT